MEGRQHHGGSKQQATLCGVVGPIHPAGQS